MICDEENLRAVNMLLQKVTILNGDFESTLDYAEDNTLFYFDPPYKPLSETSSFNSYAKDEKIKNELELASRIQRSFLPKCNSISKDNFNLSGVMKPAKEVGGDFYGYKESDGKLLFYVGDVSGKGVPASLFMMASVMLIEDAMDNSFDPSRIIQIVNNKLCKISSQGMFATLVVGVIDLKTKELTFSNAGHPPFLVKEENLIYTPIPTFCPPIATFEDLEYENRVLKLNKNSIIVVFTGGVNEAENSKKEFYGMENLTNELLSIKDTDAEIIKDKLFQKIKLFHKRRICLCPMLYTRFDNISQNHCYYTISDGSKQGNAGVFQQAVKTLPQGSFNATI